MPSLPRIQHDATRVIVPCNLPQSRDVRLGWIRGVTSLQLYEDDVEEVAYLKSFQRRGPGVAANGDNVDNPSRFCSVGTAERDELPALPMSARHGSKHYFGPAPIALSLRHRTFARRHGKFRNHCQGVCILLKECDFVWPTLACAATSRSLSMPCSVPE